MTSAVKEAFLNEIIAKSWMDEATKQKAIEKVIIILIIDPICTMKSAKVRGIRTGRKGSLPPTEGRHYRVFGCVTPARFENHEFTLQI